MATLDYEKLPANKNITAFVGPTDTSGGSLGVTDVDEPLAAELNNDAASGVLVASKAISWNDWAFGTEASETLNEPSLADASTYEEFGQANYGGTISFYYPLAYDDASNVMSNVYDLVDQPGSRQDIAIRIDGEINQTEPAADGDFVSVYRVQAEADANPFTPGESKRYTKGFLNKSDFSHLVVVGDHSVTTDPATTDTAGVDDVGRYRAFQQSRDVTNYLQWSTDDGAVIDVMAGGFWMAVGAGEADVTATDPGTGDSATITVTVSA